MEDETPMEEETPVAAPETAAPTEETPETDAPAEEGDVDGEPVM